MSPKESKALIKCVMLLAEAIRALGEIPSGHLYARVMGHMTLQRYEAILQTLIRAELVSRDGSHMLRWTGPALKGSV